MIKYISRYVLKYKFAAIVALPLISITFALLFIISYAVIIIAIRLLQVIFEYISMTIFSKIQIKSAFDINKDMIEKIYKTPYLKILKFDTAYLADQINSDSNTLSLFFVNNYINFFLNILIFFLSLFTLYKINKDIFLLSLIFIPIYILIYIY